LLTYLIHNWGAGQVQTSSISQIIDENHFLETLINALPCGVMVVDEDRRIQAVNDALERILGVSGKAVLGKRCGEALGCVYARGQYPHCGAFHACESCPTRALALEALAGHRQQRKEVALRVSANGSIQDLLLRVSAIPLVYDGRRYAIVIIEDVAKPSQLRPPGKSGRIPTNEKPHQLMLGQHPRMLELFDLIRDVAVSDIPVLIQGETGTGKEVTALAIHKASLRASRHFVAVNCAALPHGLLESELFGHVKGAFTGAIRNKPGRFELADGGTIFLDEIGELDATLQVKLLRVLQEKSFERVGGTETIKVDIRVISATNRNLAAEVAAGRFRADLFYRLCVAPLTLPTLRERSSDIPLLAEHFLAIACSKSNWGGVPITPEALELLMEYDWPGNVRELQNVMQFSLIKSGGRAILPKHLPHGLQRIDKALRHKRSRRRKLSPDIVSTTLHQADGNKLQAARMLGVSRSTLYRFLDDSVGTLS
jgi:transcriptional regulator with PAS, ATPase and Fis domain